MKLTVNTRSGARKSEAEQARRAGQIPAILYSPGQTNELLLISNAEFTAVLRNMKLGQLPTTTFTLSINGKERKAVVKDIQYEPTSYRVIHLDFQELIDGKLIAVKVPVTCIGMMDCPGLKLGGFLRQVKRHVKVECTPDRMPKELIVNIKDLNIKQAKRLSDIAIPEGVRPLISPDEVLVVIAKK